MSSLTNLTTGGTNITVPTVFTSSTLQPSVNYLTISEFSCSYEPKITFCGIDGIVCELNCATGIVTWADHIDVNEAANAFSSAMSLSLDMQAGLKASVEQRVKNVLDDMINRAERQGSITYDELVEIRDRRIFIDRIRYPDDRQ